MKQVCHTCGALFPRIPSINFIVRQDWREDPAPQRNKLEGIQ